MNKSQRLKEDFSQKIMTKTKSKLSVTINDGTKQ